DSAWPPSVVSTSSTLGPAPVSSMARRTKNPSTTATATSTTPRTGLAPRAGPVGGRSVVCMRSASSAAVTGGGATLGARSPPAQPGAPQSTDDQRVVGRGRRVVEQGAQQLVVAGGRHVEALADRGCLRR